ncbi:MAG: hypothetical protein KatS3mg118_1802 [Paracoccaceae bacterium]|nr:MAG: hypothetical protein KatS3mg118_1802 [Paracoccaceae bacterium]
MTDRRRAVLRILFGAWAAVWLGAVVAFLSTPATGDGFTRGLNRVMLFLGWQGAAALLALAAWLAGRRATGRERLAARIPALLSGLVLGGVAAIVLWAVATA